MSLSGGAAAHKRQASEESHAVADQPSAPVHDHVKDELRAEVKTLQYSINTMEQERELEKLRQDAEVREARRKGEEDFKKMQQAEGERNKAQRLLASLQKEMKELEDRVMNEKAALERKVREESEKRREIEEEVEDLKTEREEATRALERRVGDLEAVNKGLQREREELREQKSQVDNDLISTRSNLARKEKDIGEMESEVLRLKAQTGDADTLSIIKRELSEQVSHIRTLEATNREQLSELKHFRRLHKSVEVVEEEKRELQRKVERMDELEHELGEAIIQRQRLEDERLAWTAYLQSQDSGTGELEFDSPESLARALVHERLRTATLVEKLGSLEPALLEKDSIIQNLQSEKAQLSAVVEKSKEGGGNDSKARLRLERQRALAVKEVEYLRAQLQALDAEETMMQGAAPDESNEADDPMKKRVAELDNLVDQYRSEVQLLNSELASKQSEEKQAGSRGTKRARDDSADDEQLGEMSRKNRKLQAEFQELQTQMKVLQKELGVTKERLENATNRAQTRILSLRSNPTSDYEAIKVATLNSLKAENADLLAQLTGNRNVKSVPVSALEAAKRDTQDMQNLLNEERKRSDRLKKIWGAKSLEFKELVLSLLGWDVVFMPHGMRVTSAYYKSTEDEERSIVFDGDKGM